MLLGALTKYCENINVHQFPTKLFTTTAGDNWNGIMKDTLREECDPEDECLQNCCIPRPIASLFFVVFVLVAQVTFREVPPLTALVGHVKHAAFEIIRLL